MRHLMPQSAIFLALFATHHTSSQAATGPWSGSYAADGACYCTGNLPDDMQQMPVSTPNGEKSLLQVCATLGAGPQLVRSADGYNYPVYSDAQCGHGPFPNGESLSDASCAGSLNPDAGDCQGVGPTWKLEADAQAPKLVQSGSGALTTDAGNSNAGTSDYIRPITDSTDQLNVSSGNVGGTVGSRSRPHYIKAPQRTASDSAENAAVADAGTSTLKAEPLATQANAVPRVEPKRIETLAERNARMEIMIERARQRLDGTAATELPAVTSTESESPTTEIVVVKQEPVVTSDSETSTAEAPKLEEKVEETSSIITQSSDAKESIPFSAVVMNALRLPVATRQSGREFNYVAGSPAGYDYGGAGVQLEASNSQLDRVRLHALVGVAEEYKEVQLGAGVYHTPANADRLTLMASAGIEYGSFDLSDGAISTSLSDSGLFLQAGSRIVLNNKFEFNAGAGYSGFFEGDAYFFGAGFYHINSKLDAMSRFKVGDNDTFGIGIRYFY